ncbi:MAG: amidohydrolase family protein [Bacteroidota bacterium]
MLRCYTSLLFILSFTLLIAQKSKDKDIPSITFEEYNPPSTLVVPETIITKAKFPFIDIHSHHWRMGEQDLDQLIAEMDSMNMGIINNLSGRGGKSLKAMVDNVKKYGYDHRICIFTNIEFRSIDDPDWLKSTLQQLEYDVSIGAKGLKIYKSQGMFHKDKSGKRIAVDDVRLDPIWAKCGELGIPVLIHSADPKPFWQPHDANNERWLELKLKPRRKREADDPASWETIIAEQHNLFKKHPKTNFIAAHMGWYANDLTQLAKLLDEMPNMYVEIGAVIAELGRQPRMANRFLEQYQDRVLFGKDAYYPEEFPTYFRVLESDDEYFPYYKRYHAFWKMYGLDLPDHILKKIYYKNALSIVPGLDHTLFPG